MPMSSPAESSSGPPEFPGLIDASVWIMSRMVTLPAPGHGPAQGADDALGDRVVEAEGIADGDDLLPDLEVARRADDDGRQAAERSFELEDGDVLGRVAADERRLDLPLVGQADHELVALVDDVEVGDDVALVVPDEAGPAAPPDGSSDE